MELLFLAIAWFCSGKVESRLALNVPNALRAEIYTKAEEILMKCHVACLIALLLICLPTWAGPGPDQKHIDKIKKKVADCVDHPRRVSIETYDDRRLQGTISEAGPDTFVLTNSGRSTTLSYADVNKIKWASALSKQAKAIIGAMAVTGALFGLVVLLGGLRG